jgi:hypothetical protein
VSQGTRKNENKQHPKLVKEKKSREEVNDKNPTEDQGNKELVP